MIFDIAFTMIENVNNDIQISVAQGCAPGQRIITETMEEKPKDKNGQDLFTVHPTKPWLINSSDNYILMQSEIKVWFRWKDGDPFQAEHVDDFLAFQEDLTPGFQEKVNFTQGSDYIQGIYTYAPTKTTGFEDPFLKWRPYTSEGGVEIISVPSGLFINSHKSVLNATAFANPLGAFFFLSSCFVSNLDNFFCIVFSFL